jgi:hypothetical protein
MAGWNATPQWAKQPPSNVPTVRSSAPLANSGSRLNGRGASGGLGSIPSPAAAQSPVIPFGDYDPIRDIEIAEGKKGSAQALSALEKKKEYGEDDFSTSKLEDERQQGNSLSEIGTTRTRQQEAGKVALERLAESYKKLGVKQEEGANAAGVINGGALIQAAMKRAGNEGLAKSTDQKALNQQLEDDTTKETRLKESGESALGKLLRESERGLSEDTTGISNQEANEQTFGEGINSLKAYEAAHEHGYVVPTVGAQPKAAAKPAAKPSPNYLSKAKKKTGI